MFVLDEENWELYAVASVVEDDSQYVLVQGCFTMIDAGNNELWGVNPYSEIYKRTGLEENPLGLDWE